MKIILVRHGEAEDSSLAGSDRERKLTEKGIEDIHKIGQFIKNTQLKISHIFHSPYQRTKHTADILAEELHLEDHVISSDELSAGCNCCDILPDLSCFSNSDAVIIVGHNPDILHFACHLLGHNYEDNLILSPGSMIAVNVPKEKFSHGKILWVISPDFLPKDCIKSQNDHSSVLA